MREIVQLILSALFGLLPIWLIILRSRNRRRQRQSAGAGGANQPAENGDLGASVHNEPVTAYEESMLETDSIWGTQHFVPSRSFHSAPEDAHTQYAEQGEGAPETVESERASLYSRSTESVVRDTARSVATQEQDAPTTRHAATRVSLEELDAKSLRRAIILSEILLPPRSLRPFGYEQH